eukprot:4016112-Pleurochrysis_carterae.AAC.1
MRRVAAAARRSEPLVLGPSGAMWSKRKLDEFFKAAIARVATPERASALSVHSFRSYLACALLAAGATPEQIMVMLRWSSDTARARYARIAVTAHARAVDVAHDAAIEVVRSHTLLAAQNGAGSDADASR